jgi:hypothetical protein
MPSPECAPCRVEAPKVRVARWLAPFGIRPRLFAVQRHARLLCGLALVVGACRADVVDAGPDAVVEEFVARMQRLHGDPKAARDAYELLWSEGQRSLAERAKRASAVAGREVAPQAMFAPSRFWLSFLPRRYAAHVDGDWAVVTAIGDEPTQRAEVKCVREDGHWRVVLVLPPLPPIQRRDEGSETEQTRSPAQP